jgi:hypothetical protein
LLLLQCHLLFKLLALHLHLFPSYPLLAPGVFSSPFGCTAVTTTTAAHRSKVVLLLKINGAQKAHHLPLADVHPDLAV